MTATGSSTNQARAHVNLTFNWDSNPNQAKINGHLIVGSITATSVLGRIDAENDIVAFSTSDDRLKKNVKVIEDPLEKVELLRGVYFDWREDLIEYHGYEGNDIGVIAQDLTCVLSEAVRTNNNGYLSVRYEKIIPLLIESIKSLNHEIKLLKNNTTT